MNSRHRVADGSGAPIASVANNLDETTTNEGGRLPQAGPACQFIPGHPIADDNCKCLRPTGGGPYCPEHAELVRSKGPEKWVDGPKPA